MFCHHLVSLCFGHCHHIVFLCHSPVVSEYLGSFGLGPFDVPGGRVMADTTSIWILELLELYHHTGDTAFLKELYV